MTEAEFWSSTLAKISKMYKFYLKEHGLNSVENDKEIIDDKKTLNKWGRPVYYVEES